MPDTDPLADLDTEWVCRSGVTHRGLVSVDAARTYVEARLERVRAALRLVSPDDLTPAGRRIIEQALDSERSDDDPGSR